MRTCNVFDKYRDGELNSAERNEFEKHLAVCEDCRMKTNLLNNIVCALREEEVTPIDQADQIARRAFKSGNTWDTLVVSWLRPSQALAALTLVLVLFSFMWILPENQKINAYSEYEQLMTETDEMLLDISDPPVRTDSEHMLWLKQEGYSQ